MNTIRIVMLLVGLFTLQSCHTKEIETETEPGTLIVPYIDCAAVEAEDVPAVLDEAGVAFQTIGVVNWSAYPYKPSVRFRIAHTGNAILIHYQVEEKSVAALAGDGGAVYKDACCEFFVTPSNDGIYYNFETNCAGALLLQAGKGRGNQRTEAPRSAYDMVQRWASLGREPFGLRQQQTKWQLALVIPVEAFFLHSVTSLSGKTMRANFYKCGNDLNPRHYLSWRPISTPKPDFHQPKFFGSLVFE